MEAILIIYDGTSLDEDLVRWLTNEAGYAVRTLELPDDLEAILQINPDVILLQYRWDKDKNALALLNLIKVQAPRLATIVFDRSNPDERKKNELTRRAKKLLARDFIFDSRNRSLESRFLDAISDILRQRTAIKEAQLATEEKGAQ